MNSCVIRARSEYWLGTLCCGFGIQAKTHGCLRFRHLPWFTSTRRNDTQQTQVTPMVVMATASGNQGLNVCRALTLLPECMQADLVVVGSRGLGSTVRKILGVLGLGSVSDYLVSCNKLQRFDSHTDYHSVAPRQSTVIST